MTLARSGTASRTPSCWKVFITPIAAVGVETPLFRDFAETWYGEREIEWRRSYRETIRISLDKHLLPVIGEQRVGAIDKAALMAFRAELAKQPGQGGGRLSASRVNHVITRCG